MKDKRDKQVSFHLDPEMLEEFNAAVDSAGATKSGILRRLIANWLVSQRILSSREIAKAKTGKENP